MSMESEIIIQVEKVRVLQKSYFKFRYDSTLSECKKEERKLDEMVEVYNKLKKGF